MIPQVAKSSRGKGEKKVAVALFTLSLSLTTGMKARTGEKKKKKQKGAREEGKVDFPSYRVFKTTQQHASVWEAGNSTHAAIEKGLKKIYSQHTNLLLGK